MSISFDYYKVFYYVAKYQNITKAAKTLYLSQPTVSRCMQNLELSLDCSLFQRTKKGVILTPEGQLLYNNVSKACEYIFKAEEALKMQKTFSSGIIRIGATQTTLTHYMMPYFEKFRINYPNIKLKITTHSTPDAIKSVSSGFVDFAIAASPIETDAYIKAQKLWKFNDIAIAGNMFSYLKNKPMHISEIAKEPIICMEPRTTTRKFWEKIFLENGITLNPEIELETPDLITSMAEHNMGIGFVPEAYAKNAIEKGTIFKIKIAENIPSRYICIITDSRHPISAAGNKFIELLKENI
jgi:DNA-binding transcriptional LysR family regulator